MAKAFTPEAPGSRYMPNVDFRPMLQAAIDADNRERATLAKDGQSAEHLPPADYLALSGGGASGAFGAGLLVGWTEHGDRPKFKVVTGVSAGALVAPFAFLGQQFDDVLRTAFSSIGPRDIFHMHSIFTVLSGDAVADTRPLSAIVEKFVTDDVIAGVAREYGKGRLLLIGTTDLDADQPVVWNMGEIASSTDPRARELFRKILLASAAIPGLFPPVMIDVDVNGVSYQEMHVDGGVKTQVFFAPPTLVQELNGENVHNARVRHLYVIRNGRVDPQPHSVARQSSVIARRALRSLIDSQGVNDLYRLQEAAQRESEDFSVAYIDKSFNYPQEKMFSSEYMTQLFHYSRSLAARGQPWHKTLPASSEP